MGLLNLFSGQRSAVIGVAKNCGKTTTLNFMIELYAAEFRNQFELGVCSIGIDGETSDYLIGTPKPPVRVMEGMWCVSVRSAFDQSDARFEFVEPLSFETPLGRPVLARVLEAGDLMLAGVRQRADLHEIMSVFEAHGVSRVLIDGAYGRVAAAHADLVDSVIVSTGAIISPRPDQVIAKTRELVERLRLPEVETEWERELLRASMREERVMVGGETEPPRPLQARSALLALKELKGSLSAGEDAVAIPGLVSDKVLDGLMAARSKGTLLVSDGTSIHADASRFQKFRRHWHVRVLASQKVLGISVNPTSITGWKISEEALLASFDALWPEIAIFNPNHGLHSRGRAR